MDLKKICAEIGNQALVEIAKGIISTVNDVEAGKLELERARLKISACKHLLQVMAIERMSVPPNAAITFEGEKA